MAYSRTLLPENLAPEPKRWTADEFNRLLEGGLLCQDGERFELLEGEIFKKMGQNDPHIISVLLTLQALRLAFGAGHVVEGQFPVRLDDKSVPEPDITVLRGTLRDYDQGIPLVAGIELLVEVADSRLDTARKPKIELYARQGVPEYWIVNLRARNLEVRRRPRRETGEWTETHIFEEGESVTPLAAQSAVAVADLLPRVTNSETPA